jgi:cell division protein YceG involved in septum cleavage
MKKILMFVVVVLLIICAALMGVALSAAIKPPDIDDVGQVMLVMLYGEEANRMVSELDADVYLDRERGFLAVANTKDPAPDGNEIIISGPYDMRILRGASAMRVYKEQGSNVNLFIDHKKKLILFLDLGREV